jgi:hypothetical protein
MGAWGETAWANDSALDWAGSVTDKIADSIEEQIKGEGRFPSNSKVIAAGDLLNQLTPYRRVNGETRWGKGPLGLHYIAERKKLFSRMVAQLECIRADEDWLSGWADEGEGSKAEIMRIINALRRKVKHER